MLEFHQKCYAAHERLGRLHREAQAERLVRRARARRQRRRRQQLAAALGRLSYA